MLLRLRQPSLTAPEARFYPAKRMQYSLRSRSRACSRLAFLDIETEKVIQLG